jgi:lysophospholipase L1-like esterase
MSEPGAKPLQSIEWFPAPPPGKHGGLGSALGKVAVGAAMGLLLFLRHHPTAGYVVWGITGVLGGVSLSSSAARAAIDRALAAFGRRVGTVIGAVLLTAVYVVVVTPTRFVRRLLGADDLHLRDEGRPSYWLDCDADVRKVRWAGSMFATEVRSKVGHPLRNAIIAIVALVLLSEGVLRAKGFGHTVLYVADPDIGYYPQPNAELIRYGGRVATNEFGMRSPDVAREKPPGTFRILMIGDSTLYGGSYIDQEDMYATVLQKRLTALGVPGKIEVLAMGCNGWGPFHEHGFVRRYPDAFGADLTMIQMPIDDVVRPLYGLMNVPFFSDKAPPRIALEEVANHLMWRYKADRVGIDDAWQERQAVYGIREYGLLTDDLLRAGTEVMAFVLPRSSPGYDKPPPTDAEDPSGRIRNMLSTDERWRMSLTDTLAKRGVATYFARGFFKDKGPEELIYRDDGLHLETLGHHVYAEYLESKVVDESQRFRQWRAKP